MCYYHPFRQKWQRRQMVNRLLFWMPVFCIAFLVVYLVYFVCAVTA